MNEFILVDKSDGIAVITINRPDKLNSLNEEVLKELEKTLDELEDDNEIKVLLIRGAGDKAFVAGADIGELKELNKETGFNKSKRGQELFNRLEQLSKPVIAAINGYALGGGLELAMACDFRIASENAKLGQPEINLGIIPGYGGTQRLARIVGISKAKELIFLGDMIEAEEALRIGLINKVVPHEKLMEEAISFAKRLKEKPPLALKAAKKALREAVERGLTEGLSVERELFAELCETEDKREGMSAFLEKRKPHFRGK